MNLISQVGRPYEDPERQGQAKSSTFSEKGPEFGLARSIERDLAVQSVNFELDQRLNRWPVLPFGRHTGPSGSVVFDSR